MKRLAALMVAAGAVMAVAGCAVPLPGTAEPAVRPSGSITSAGDVHTVDDLATFIGTRTRSDKTCRFTVSLDLTVPGPSSNPTTGDGSARATDSAVDLAISLTSPASGPEEMAVIGPDLFTASNDRNSVHRSEARTVQSVIYGPGLSGGAQMLILNSMWVMHPETLNGAFTLIGSSADKTQDGQAVTRYRLSADMAKAEDLVDLRLGFPSTNHAALAPITVSLDYLVNSDARIVGFTSVLMDSSKPSNEGGVTITYKFADWGQPVNIAKPN